MALCIPSGLGADRITSVVFVDEDFKHSLSWQLHKADDTAQAKEYLIVLLLHPAVLHPISLLITAGLEKGQQYSLGTGPLTLHSKKENMGNQMRALRLC